MRNTCSVYEKTAKIKTKFSNKINNNNVILIKNLVKSRLLWLLGRVIELFSGSDHKACSAQIKSGDGTVEIHSFKHLYPLELSLMHNYFPNTPADEVSDDENSTPPQNYKDPNVVEPSKSTNTVTKARKKKSKTAHLYY